MEKNGKTTCNGITLTFATYVLRNGFSNYFFPMCTAKHFMFIFFPTGMLVEQEAGIGMSQQPNVAEGSGQAVEVVRDGNNQSTVNSEQARISERDGSGASVMGGEDDRDSHSPERARMNGSDDGRVDEMTDEDDNMSMNSSN